jgi:hypothetical protein
MTDFKVSHLERILSCLKKSSRKYLSLEALSRLVGLYPDVLGDELSYFEPMIRMDPSLNMKDLIPTLENYIASEKAKKVGEEKPKRQVARKKEIAEYPNIATFVYQKMTGAGGLVDPSLTLSDHDLHVLQKLVSREVSARKKKGSKGNS